MVVLFDEIGESSVRVRFAQLGRQKGEDWDLGFTYFDSAWGWVLTTMKKNLED